MSGNMAIVASEKGDQTLLYHAVWLYKVSISKIEITGEVHCSIWASKLSLSKPRPRENNSKERHETLRLTNPHLPLKFAGVIEDGVEAAGEDKQSHPIQRD